MSLFYIFHGCCVENIYFSGRGAQSSFRKLLQVGPDGGSDQEGSSGHVEKARTGIGFEDVADRTD